MNVTITSCKNPEVEQELVAATKFFAEELLSHKMLPHITVHLIMKSSMKDLGSCGVSFYNDWYKPREFEIELRKYRSMRSTLITLAHEMVHLKQFAKGELNANQNRWCKVPFDIHRSTYLEYPWEVEANRKERILYKLYTQQNHIRNHHG